jgi:hypothetical protein
MSKADGCEVTLVRCGPARLTGVTVAVAQEHRFELLAGFVAGAYGVLAVARQVTHRLVARVGIITAVSSPARAKPASESASRRSVLMRSPGRRGILAGATTSQPKPAARSSRARPYPHGPAS